MCYPEKCPHCGKTGWAGCGQHVDDVMRSVPAAQRCTCNPDSDREPNAPSPEHRCANAFTAVAESQPNNRTSRGEAHR
jgi:hypothetical protein